MANRRAGSIARRNGRADALKRNVRQSTPASARSRNIGLGALLPCGERIEIDELRIVVIGFATEPSAAMNVHQGLHTPGIR